MNQDYKCKRCSNIFTDEQSDKFVKTVIRRCPICGSSNVVRIGVLKVNTKGFAKKIKE